MEEIESENTSTNVIYITEEHRVEWINEATRELLKLYDEKCDLLESGIITTQKRLWELVSRDMAKKEFYYTGAQCENKWKTLKRCYRNKIDRLSTHGTSKRPCPFQEEITEILSKRPFESMMRSYAIKRNTKKEDSSFGTPGFSGDITDPPEDKADEEDYLQSPDYVTADAASNSRVVEQVADLAKAIGKSHQLNTNLLGSCVELQGKLAQFFEGASERDCQRLELEETRMEQQNEMIKQMKIQNGLLQKLLERLG